MTENTILNNVGNKKWIYEYICPYVLYIFTQEYVPIVSWSYLLGFQYCL